MTTAPRGEPTWDTPEVAHDDPREDGPQGARRPGRRERNKQDKLDRILAAATELFTTRGVDDVTTQQVAELADIGTGTLFLYARTKGELLLMVQNSLYAKALASGRAASAHLDDPVEAILAVLAPVVACNRSHVQNGRTYLRELMFGEPDEPHRAEALAIVVETAELITSILRRTGAADADAAPVLTGLIEARMFLVMASADPGVPVDGILAEVARSIAVLVHGPTTGPA